MAITDVNDVDAILALTNRDVDELVYAVQDNADALFTWDYEKGKRPALNKLYEKAKTSQWNAETDLDWSIDVDIEKVCAEMAANDYRAQLHPPPGRDAGLTRRPLERQGVDGLLDRDGEPPRQPVPPRRAGRAAVHRQDRRDGAVDRRQVLRRHPGDGRGPPRRGVRHATSTTKLDGHYPINAHLRMLLDDIIQRLAAGT